MSYELPAGIRVSIAPASERPQIGSGFVPWKEHMTKKDLLFDTFVAQNSGSYFFVEGDWLIRVGKGQVLEIHEGE